MGLFATETIPYRTRVIAEEALFQAPLEGFPRDILRGVVCLTTSEKSKYLSLNGFTSEWKNNWYGMHLGRTWEQISESSRKVLEIYSANAIDGGIFLRGTRMNYSCLPNIVHAYNPVTKKRTFHALRDITAQEELTISYINDPNLIRHERQKILDEYGFLCTCLACGNTESGKSDARRRNVMTEYRSDLVACMNSGSWTAAEEFGSRLALYQKSMGCMPLALSST